MFCILEIIPAEPQRHSFFRRKAREPEIFLEKIEGNNFSSYYIIRAQEGSDGIPWNEIENIAGRCKKRMLIGDSIILPENTQLERFIPGKFPMVLLFNTAEEILKRLNRQPKDIICSIIDKNAKALEFCEKLLPYAATIKVLTSKANTYLKLSEEIFRQYGASIIVTEDERNIKDSSFTVSLSEEVALFPEKSFTLAFGRNSSSKVLALGKIELPGEFYIRKLEGISKFDFLAAMYELSNAAGLADIFCKTVFYGNKEISLSSAADLMNLTNN